MKLLLHACCGPCSLEPFRLLQEAGHTITIAYANSNIHPHKEYLQRRDTLLAWADEQSIEVIELPYNPASWHAVIGSSWTVSPNSHEDHQARCRICYRTRFEDTACYANKHGFDGIGTTLTVSPYQFIETIGEELQRAALPYHLDIVFEDYRPYYQEATRISKEQGMYRQNYCGCIYSEQEAAQERAKRKEARRAAKAARTESPL